MNAELLLAHYDRISDAPDAVARLRKFILDLAVRGKLVEQDMNDEPASELLLRIQREKWKLFGKCNVRVDKPQVPIAQDELPFELMPNWQAARMSDVLLEIQTGPFGSSLHQSDYQKNGVPVINPASIQNERLIPIEKMAVGPTTLERLATFKLHKGDIVMARRGEMGRCAVVTEREDGWLCGTGSLILRLASCVSERYFVLLIGSPFVREYLGGSAVGATMQNLNQSILLNLIVGLPPFAEQNRIVAKVDELMALCDRLEASRREQETHRDQLTASAHHHLNNGEDTEERRTRARFFIGNLTRLTKRPDQIKQLRQTILNLAVRGKLVPQTDTDEPVMDLLHRIQAEQKDLLRRRVIKGREYGPASPADEAFIEIPQTWQFVFLGKILTFGPQNGISPTASSRPEAPRSITLTATTSGTFKPEHFKQIEANIPADSEFWIRQGDLLFQRGNTREYVGMAAYYDGEPGQFLYPDLIIKVRPTKSVDLRYIHLCSTAPYARAYFGRNTSGAQSTMPKINHDILVNLPIPLPPFAEQHRIVAMVDELMALCDKLEARLSTAQTETSRLLESVLHHALEASA
jgi:type I restriction enzyme S subunit